MGKNGTQVIVGASDRGPKDTSIRELRLAADRAWRKWHVRRVDQLCLPVEPARCEAEKAIFEAKTYDSGAAGP